MGWQIYAADGTLKTAFQTAPAAIITGQVAVANGGTGIDGSSQAINKVIASPASGGAGPLTLRSLVSDDIPALTSPVINTGVSGTAIDTDSTMAANSDTLLASQKAIKSHINALVFLLAQNNNVTGTGNFASGHLRVPGEFANIDDGFLQYNSSVPSLLIGDSQRARSVSVVGWTPYAFPVAPMSTGAQGSAIALAANGGSLIVPIHVPAHMLLDTVLIGFSDTTAARSYKWGIFDMPLNNGNAGENTLPLNIDISTEDSYTAAAAGLRSSVPSTQPWYLAPGVYMMLIQNRHATNGLSISTFNQGVYTGQFVCKTKTLTNPFTTTVDIVAATWTGQVTIPAIRLKGRIAGMTAAWM